MEGKGLRATHWSSVFGLKTPRTIFKSVVSDLADGNKEAVELKKRQQGSRRATYKSVVSDLVSDSKDVAGDSKDVADDTVPKHVVEYQLGHDLSVGS